MQSHWLRVCGEVYAGVAEKPGEVHAEVCIRSC